MTTYTNAMRRRGILLVLAAAVFWAAGGAVTQFLFHTQHLSPEWLVTIRMLLAGTLILVPTACQNVRELFLIWRSPDSRRRLLIFAIFGMMLMQYSYFVAIQTSNAATATILQYLAPSMIALYSIIRARTSPTLVQVVAILFALAGTFLLVTKGDIHSLALSPTAIAWGIFSAGTLAFYTVYPSHHLIRWPSPILLGWAMIIGGIAMIPLGQPWQFVGEASLASLAGILFIIIFGTICSFYCFLESIKYITPQEAGTLASSEALFVVLLSIAFLSTPFHLLDWIGGACIVLTVILLARQPSNQKRHEQ